VVAGYRVVMTPRPGFSPRQLLAWPRLRATLITATLLFLLLSLAWESSKPALAMRVYGIALVLMLVFGLFEQWPARLPRGLARWVLQVLAVAVVVPPLVFAIYWTSTEAGAPPFWKDEKRVSGFFMLTVFGVLIAPWVALGALVRQREAWGQQQAKLAMEAQQRLARAQVQPHFLFNTLANVQALVEAGSPRAASLLESLIAYLRAAVPRLDAERCSLGEELELVRAYLSLMQTRMPDRLQFSLQVDPGCETLLCPPMTLLTLVENAVRHGIDPSETGGRIHIEVRREGGRCRLQVSDTGVGLRAGGSGLGTGLAALRERLRLAFGASARLELFEVQPQGVRAEILLPMTPEAA
jgi:signal transduction histidine kinase